MFTEGDETVKIELNAESETNLGVDQFYEELSPLNLLFSLYLHHFASLTRLTAFMPYSDILKD